MSYNIIKFNSQPRTQVIQKSKSHWRYQLKHYIVVNAQKLIKIVYILQHIVNTLIRLLYAVTNNK